MYAEKKPKNSLTSCELYAILIPSKYRIITNNLRWHEPFAFGKLQMYYMNNLFEVLINRRTCIWISNLFWIFCISKITYWMWKYSFRFVLIRYYYDRRHSSFEISKVVLFVQKGRKNDFPREFHAKICLSTRKYKSKKMSFISEDLKGG